MSLEIGQLVKSLIANSTGVGPLFGVQSHSMFFKMIVSSESLTADFTAIRFLSSVYSRMYFEVVLLVESLIAYLTDVGFIPGMYSYVFFKVTFLGKRLIADYTIEGPFSGVSSHMTLEMVS